MKKAFEDCNDGTLCEVANCVAMISNRVADLPMLNVSAAPSLDT